MKGVRDKVEKRLNQFLPGFLKSNVTKSNYVITQCTVNILILHKNSFSFLLGYICRHVGEF